MITVVNKRTFKGEHGVYIGRGSVLGNPYTHKQGTKAEYVVGSVQEAVDYYERYLVGKVANKDRDTCNEMNRLYKYYKEHGELNLICYCKWKGHEPCHGDVIKNMLESALRKSADSWGRCLSEGIPMNLTKIPLNIAFKEPYSRF